MPTNEPPPEGAEPTDAGAGGEDESESLRAHARTLRLLSEDVRADADVRRESNLRLRSASRRACERGKRLRNSDPADQPAGDAPPPSTGPS